MKGILVVSLTVLAVVSHTNARSQGTRKYDGTISFDLAGNSSVQRQHALDVLWHAVQDAFGRVNGLSSKGEGDHTGSGRISGTVNFAGERQRPGEQSDSVSTTDSTKDFEVEELENEEVEQSVTFEEESDD